MTAAFILVGLLAGAALLGIERLLLWQRRAASEARAKPWRLAVLVALQPLSAALLYATFLPPDLGGDRATLVVLTRGSRFDLAQAGGDRVVALPSASGLAGAERVPDLATALRHYPATARLRIVGEGLDSRDRAAAAGRAIDYRAPALPRGLVRIDPPLAVAQGATFGLGGRVAGVDGGSVELIDPAGRRVDAATIGPAGEFRLVGTARAAGPVLFGLRIRDAARGLVEEVELPVAVDADPQPAVLLLAGAPGPEIKYLRRWANDAGLALRVQAGTGGGVSLGDAAGPLTPSILQRTDLLVVDDRSWASLGGGERAAVGEAVAGGMGLLLRVTGPLPDSIRSQWRALGLAVASGGETVALAQPRAAPDDEAARARRGPGTRDSATVAADEVPDLTRRVVTVGQVDIVPLLRDAKGAPFAYWRARGRGRVGLWTLDDSFMLVLSGHGDRHADYWSTAFAALARPRVGGAVSIDGIARVGQRIALCGAGARVLGPDGKAATLLVDPATVACAAYWPDRPGWHWLARADPKAARQPFFVYPGDGLSGARTAAVIEATVRLAADAQVGAPRGSLGSARRGPSWPWFLAWLAVSAGLWWFERSRLGRTAIEPAIGT